MIIHEPEIIKQGEYSILASRVEMNGYSPDVPKYLWYRIHESHSQYISTQSDAFLVPGLVAGMHFKENIHVRGTVSPKLAYHLTEYQKLLSFRMPELVSPVDIKYERVIPWKGQPTSVGCTFSGGVDSFFTIWKHLPQNQPIPQYRITHALFILGEDIRNSSKHRFNTLYSNYRDALQESGIILVPIESNIMNLLASRLDLLDFFGAALIDAAHAMGNLFHQYIISSSVDHWHIHMLAKSSDPTADPLPSSDTTNILHYGAEYRRVEKIQAISDWSPAQKHLRVCQEHASKEGAINCSRCEKCTQTMTTLYVLGKLEKFKTFNNSIRSNVQAVWWARKFDFRKGYFGEIFPFVKKHKPDLLPWLWFGAILGYLRYQFVGFIPGFLRRYLQRFGYFSHLHSEERALDTAEIDQFILLHTNHM